MEHRLPCDVASIRAARRLATDFAEDRLSDVKLDELVLMVSEVVSNAVRHGHSSPMETSGYVLKGIRMLCGSS